MVLCLAKPDILISREVTTNIKDMCAIPTQYLSQAPWKNLEPDSNSHQSPGCTLFISLKAAVIDHK